MLTVCCKPDKLSQQRLAAEACIRRASGTPIVYNPALNASIQHPADCCCFCYCCAHLSLCVGCCLPSAANSMLQQHSSPGLPYRLARGFHTSKLTKEEVDYYQDRMQGIIAYMGQHKPWLLKDPRMSWLAALWLERLEAPVCVLVVDMQPQRLAEHLSAQQLLSNSRQHQQLPGGASSGEIEVSAATHVERWTNATLSALKVWGRRGGD